MEKSTLTLIVVGILLILGLGGYGIYRSKQPGAPSEQPTVKTFALDEIARHATSSDCWMAIDGNIYDVTAYVASGQHPGGDAILKGCGKDATGSFNSVAAHEQAKNLLTQYYIGDLSIIAGQPATIEPIVKVGKSDALGEFLVAGNDMTLYLYTKDEPNKSNCYGQCAINWPPLAPSAELKAGEGVTGELTVIDRTDGTKQVAYKGVPLYFWFRDAKPGDTTGQGVGNVWFVVKH